MADDKKAQEKEEKKPEETKEKSSKSASADKLSNNAKKVVEMVEQMSVLELNDLVEVLEEKFGVSAAPVATAGAAPTAGGETPAEQAEEKSEYNIELADAGSNKIAVIKAVRTINPNLGLVEAKGIVESAPKVIAENVKKEEAEQHKKALEEAGAKVNLV